MLLFSDTTLNAVNFSAYAMGLKPPQLLRNAYSDKNFTMICSVFCCTVKAYGGRWLGIDPELEPISL